MTTFVTPVTNLHMVRKVEDLQIQETVLSLIAQDAVKKWLCEQIVRMEMSFGDVVISRSAEVLCLRAK